MPDSIERGEDTLTLRLSAFAFADVASYSRHMETDSVGAVRNWAHLRETILLPELGKLSGRAIAGAGDAILVEFSSATDAVRWALRVQAAIRALPIAQNAMQLRIGINIDDVIDDGETLQSDGVVIASRIHQQAAPGEVVLTQIARDIVVKRLPVAFRDLGMPQLKNIDRPVRVFAVEEASVTRSVVRPHADWGSRPTLAVLPFVDASASEGDRYFGEGITEDIIAGLSRSRAMFVIARTSALHFTNDNKSPREIADALGVKYLVSGSIRRQSDKLRIHTELMEVDRNRAVWADNYDGDTSDLFEFQDRIASSIVAALEPKVLSAEAAKLGTRPTESLDAYDCVLRALSQLYKFEGSSYAQAMQLLERAVELDPDYAQAHAYMAWCLNFWIAEGHSKDREKDRERAITSARRAVELDPSDGMNLSIRAHILSFVERKPYEALELLDEALALNENLPIAWALSATSHAYVGNGDEARARLLNVWRLSPYDPLNFFFLTAGGLGEFVAGRYGDAVRILNRARRSKPHFMAALRLLAASLALNGREAEAHIIAEKILAEDPQFSISRFMSWYPLVSPATRERLILGLSKAGLPG